LLQTLWPLLLFAGVFVFVYARLRRRIGSEQTRRRFFRFVPMLLAGIALFAFAQRGSVVSKSVLQFLQDYFTLGLAGAEWFALLTWPIRKRRAGKLLQDLGPHPAARTMWFLALSSVLAGVASLMGNMEKTGFHWSILGTEAFLFSSAIVAVVIARSRVTATERGLLRFDHQFDWNQIRSWTFVRGGVVDLLELRVRTWIPWVKNPTIEVPIESRPILERLLSEHAPASGVGTTHSSVEHADSIPQQALRSE
jgi:hypothetical protein